MVNFTMIRTSLLCLALVTASFLPAAGGPSGECATDAMLVFDGSGSMVEFGFDPRQITRIAEARQAVARAMPQIAPTRRIGLLIYGPNDGDSCSGIHLRFPPRADAAEPVIADVNGISPGGLTPLAASVQTAADVLNYHKKPGVIVVVTDGNETCGGRPCALGATLAAEARDLTIHVIGFRAIVDFWTWDNPEQEISAGDQSVARCLADSTGGMYVSANTVQELVDALQETLGCPLYGALPFTRPEDARRRG
ncbi:vWA domain-containing protein [Pseudooceanicola sp. C21-150M6]|uniref:vWA domain-containing protein n=1 Tax=Pseudooceanicola sp. C21-150M6 TaxID=3434355 RepID=UPI003D7F5310